MIINDVEPSVERLVNSLRMNSVGRQTDIFAFLHLLESIEHSGVIGVEGNWGSGKTYFIKQCKLILDSYNTCSPFSQDENNKEICTLINGLYSKYIPDKCNSFLTAYYDAWRHDDESHPLISLMYEIGKEISGGMDISIRGKLSDTFLKVADAITDRNISDIISTYKGKDIFSEIREQEEISNKIREYLNNCLLERGNKLIIFIDELDRCAPTYAVRLLERIKHYFCCENVIFVFAINPIELQKTIRNYYGNEFDSCRYLDRFFDIRVELPPVDIEKYVEMIGLYKGDYYREIVSLAIAKQMGMSMRETSRFMYMSKVAAYKFTDKENPKAGGSSRVAYTLGFSIAVPIAIGLKITDSDSYQKFVNGNDSKWLERIMMSDYIGERLFDALLNEGETYDKDISKITVTKEHKIKEVYNAMFLETTNNGWKRGKRVGRAEFEAGFKNLIMQAVGLVSDYSEYNV